VFKSLGRLAGHGHMLWTGRLRRSGAGSQRKAKAAAMQRFAPHAWAYDER